MYEFNTSEQRSNLMKKIKSNGTVPEKILEKELWHKGIRYRKNYNNLPGKPDIAITKYKIAIFIDGEFWHGYNWVEKKEKIKSNRDYWIPKIERTIARDKNNVEQLHAIGWVTLRFWEKEIKKNLDDCVNRVIEEIEKQRSVQSEK